MRKKQSVKIDRSNAFVSDEEIVVAEQFDFSDKVTFNIGDKLKIKRQRGVFTFVRLVTSPNRDAQWIDVFDKNGQFRAFYVCDIRGPAKVRKRKKKSV